jgi:hypothetical protein
MQAIKAGSLRLEGRSLELKTQNPPKSAANRAFNFFKSLRPSPPPTHPQRITRFPLPNNVITSLHRGGPANGIDLHAGVKAGS